MSCSSSETINFKSQMKEDRKIRFMSYENDSRWTNLYKYSDQISIIPGMDTIPIFTLELILWGIRKTI